MSIYETFTKRLKRSERAGKADVYQYDTLPQEFRVQVIHIWKKAIGPFRPSYSTPKPYLPYSTQTWIHVSETLSKERGVFCLDDPQDNPDIQCMNVTTLVRVACSGKMSL
jgi:hypothetical protein